MLINSAKLVQLWTDNTPRLSRQGGNPLGDANSENKLLREIVGAFLLYLPDGGHTSHTICRWIFI